MSSRPVPPSAVARSAREVRNVVVTAPAPVVVAAGEMSLAPQPAAASTGDISAPAARRSLDTQPAAQRIGAAGSVVDSVFDAVADWLSSFPPNPLTGLVEGALLMVRRTLFNQAPTAAPVQWAQTPTDIVGTVGATDAEGDPIVYTVLTQPQYGTIEINPDTGSYTYTPTAFDRYGGTDEFTVRLTDTGNHLHLLQNASTDVRVPIAIAGVDNLQGYTRGVDIYNLTSRTLEYFLNDRGSDDLDSGPAIGTKFLPGEKAHFEITWYAFRGTTVRVGFRTTDATDPANWAVDMVTNLTSAGTRSCFSSGNNACSASMKNPTAYFFDAPNTVINVAGSDKQTQADWLNGLCFSGSTAQCGFTVNQTKTDPGGPLSNKFANPVLAAPTYTNNTGRDQVWSSATSVAQTTETNWSLALNVKATLIEKVLEASLTGTYGQRWSTTTTFTNTYTTTVPDGKTAYLYQRNPVRTAVGDFTVKMGNTTWNLTDVEFVYPDPSRQPNVTATFAPIT